MGPPRERELPASGLGEVDDRRVDLARRRVRRLAEVHHLRSVGAQSRGDRQRITVARKPHDPQHLVRGVARMSGAQLLREEERTRGTVRRERVRDREPRTRVRPSGRRPGRRRAAMDRRRDTWRAGAGGDRCVRRRSRRGSAGRRSRAAARRQPENHCHDEAEPAAEDSHAPITPAGAAQFPRIRNRSPRPGVSGLV